MKTYVYIDGFNLYYGAVKGTRYRWLNIAEMCRQLLPKHQVIRLKYFTALVTPRPGDPDLLANSQFPAALVDAQGAFSKPSSW